MPVLFPAGPLSGGSCHFPSCHGSCLSRGLVCLGSSCRFCSRFVWCWLTPSLWPRSSPSSRCVARISRTSPGVAARWRAWPVRSSTTSIPRSPQCSSVLPLRAWDWAGLGSRHLPGSSNPCSTSLASGHRRLSTAFPLSWPLPSSPRSTLSWAS